MPERRRQMVEHQRREHHVERRIGEGEPLGAGVPERHLGAGARRLTRRQRDHLRRCVHAHHRARRANAPLRREGERSRSAAHVEYRLAGCEPRELRQPIAERALASEREHRREYVVPARLSRP
jgi:hypothetical protein